MTLDLDTAFLLFFPLTLIMIVANRFVVLNIPEQRFVRHWNAYLTTWLVVYVAIFAQSYLPLIGQLVVRASTPFFLVTYIRTINSLVGRERFPKLTVILLLAATEIPMIAETLIASGDVLRAWLGSVHHLAAHVYGILCLLQLQRAKNTADDVSRQRGFLVLLALEVIFVVVWIARTAIGVLTVSSASAGILIEGSTYNVVSSLSIPQTVLLLNLFFTVLSHGIESQRAARASRSLLGRITDSRLLHVASGFSHEISGPLGNLILLSDTLANKNLSNEDRSSVAEMGRRAFTDIESVIIDRRRLTEAELEGVDEIEVGQALDLLNRLLARGFLARSVRFVCASPSQALRVSLPYLITVLSGVAELIVTEVQPTSEILRVDVVTETRGDRDVFILSGPALKSSGDVLRGDSSGSHGEKLGWLRAFVGRYFEGLLEPAQRDGAPMTVELSFHRKVINGL